MKQHPCLATTKSADDDNKTEGVKDAHHHMMANDPKSKSGNHHSTFIYYDLILQQDAKEASNHRLNQKSLQRSRKFRSKREDDGTWSYHHFLYTVKEEEEGETEEQVSLSHSHSHANLQSHGHSHGNLQRSDNSKSSYVSIADCYDLMIKSKEKRRGALGGMQQHVHRRSKEGKVEDGLERSRSKTSLGHGMYIHGGGGGGKGISMPSKTKPPSMKKVTKSRLAYKGSTSCYSLLFLCLLRPLKRLRDQYIKCCFSFAGAGGDLSVLVGEGHVVGPLFHEWFPQESKCATPRSDNILLW